jgi:methylmalonyl-CoA mutase C-terminal domain/subunit
MTLVPRVLELMKQAGLEGVGLIVGGIIPEADIPKLRQMGVAHVFGPGTSMPQIVEFVKRESEARHARPGQPA